MKYTIEEVEHLRNIRLKAWREDGFFDDLYTNEYENFKHETEILIKWIKKMETLNKIEVLLSTMPLENCNRTEE